MSLVEPDQEPEDAWFDHPKSNRRFQVTRKDGELWHLELLLKNGAAEKVLAKHPVKYVVGSGRYAQSYLAEVDGFLIESPVTWYASRQGWGLSPGYDRVDHMGFRRGIGQGCLTCHAGQSEALERSEHRMQITEATISCERCHGPGSLHVAMQSNRKPKDPPLERDYTIVNPKDLSRERVEAVCQQCHLHGDATVPLRGRESQAFRPGLPLQDFRLDYCLESSDGPMKVVGHVEQMHLSECYRQSATLTCTTCHNPHESPEPAERIGYYRKICNNCHSCSEPEPNRLLESPNNDCVQCHMPSSPTDVAHVSFTHHRIGIHRRTNEQAKEDASSQAGVLRPFLPNPKLGEVEQTRSLGLAYFRLSQGNDNRSLSGEYRRRSFRLLSAAYDAGLRDPMLEADLARLHFEQNSPMALMLAKSALRNGELIGVERCRALFVLGGEYFRRASYEDARDVFRELVTLRRHADDWFLLGQCEQKLGNSNAAKDALSQANQIHARPNGPP